MTVKEFLAKFSEQAESRPTLRAILLLPNLFLVANLMGELLDSPGEFIVSNVRRTVTHPSGAQLLVQLASREVDKYRLGGLQFQLLGYSIVADPAVLLFARERLRAADGGELTEFLVAP